MTKRLIVAAVVLLSASSPLAGQIPAASPHPSFAGTWAPADLERSDTYFNVGLSPIPGTGRLIVEQRGVNRLTVTITIPDERLEGINPRFYHTFYATIIYRLFEPEGRGGGAGAGGAPQPTVPTWVGDRLLIPDWRPSTFPTLTTFSMDGDQLKIETQVDRGAGRGNTVTQWFKKGRP